jgi:glycosyltransferase involved in cell wall biosynthesis
MITVCLAAYNGEKYVEEQINSILCQLSFNDELLISDDGSTDKTLKIISELCDPRIKIFKNNFKCVQKNFEFLLQNSNGDIIFLSDQDDVWSSIKVKEYLKCFEENPKADLLISDLDIIDYKGNLINRKFYNSKFSKNLFKNLFKNNFIGCSMAFRKSLLKKFLPFPKDVPMHDWWIGLCSIVFGNVYFIDKKLIKYRRHETNVTNDMGESLLQKIIWRTSITKSLFRRTISNILSWKKY